MILKRFTKFSDFTVKTPYKRRTVREIPRICERTIKECLADGIKKGAILPRSKSV